MAKEIHSGGTSRPSLNCRGSITSKRRHFVLIGRWAIHGVGSFFGRQRFQSRFGYDVEAATEHLASKSAHQDRQPFDLGFAIRELDKDHDRSSLSSLPETARK